MILPFLIFGCRTETKPAVEDDIVNETVDFDGDGYNSEEDCNDQDATIFPSATELCDGIDNDCDEEIDEDVRTVFYLDADQDGYGTQDQTQEACEQPAGYALSGTDCLDTDATVYPGAEELCDGVDNNCNDEVDENLEIPLYIDSDGDGFGDPNQEVFGCNPELGLSAYNTDCNDQDASTSPIANELCDELDNNCDGTIDEGVTTTYYEDFDNDGFGNPSVSIESCTQPEDYVLNAQDCLDTNSEISPVADEFCDGTDNDCDGVIDEDASLDAITYYLDTDEDGYGDTNQSTKSCSLPSGYAAQDGDCNDGSANIHPGILEICDGIDNNCDGTIDEETASDASTWYLDSDQDGFGATGLTQQACSQPTGFSAQAGDCLDSDENIHPQALEICDGLDNDCDGATDDDDSSISTSSQTTWYLDTDQDGYGDSNNTQEACSAPSGHVSISGDCNDSEASINPNATEICDGIDNDCDGANDDDDSSILQSSKITSYADADEDGFGDANDSATACFVPTGNVTNDDDCDDTDPAEYPGVPWYHDNDGDGFGSGLSAVCARLDPSDVSNNDDCDDSINSVYPSAPQGCDGTDYDCDGTIDNDGDLDGFSDATCGGLDCNDADPNILPEQNGECAMGVSCLDILESGLSYGDNDYLIDPDGFSNGQDPIEVYCDMTIDGGGWTLIARSHPEADSSAGTWGWYGPTRGYPYDFTQAYNIGFKDVLFDHDFEATEIMFGNRKNLYTNEWGPFAYKYSDVDLTDLMTSTAAIDYPYSTVQSDTSIYNYTTPPNMQNLLGFAQQGTNYTTSLFYMRDCCGFSVYGGAAYGMRTTYVNNATVWYYSGPWGIQNDAYTSNGDFVQVGDTGNQPKYGGTWHYMLFAR